MKTIYKYAIGVEDSQGIWMPWGAEILSVQCQGGRPFVWAMVDTMNTDRERRFVLVGTGHPCNDLERGKYVGTFQQYDGALVFHLFDLGDKGAY